MTLFGKGGSRGGLLGSDDEYERLFVGSLPLIERLCRFFCRNSRLSTQDVEDFIGTVRLHFLENDYAVLRSFEGRCALPTWLSLVIQRLLFDYRVQVWGRFRTSAAAQRLGPAAVRLEMLLLRDGLSLPEAVSVLASEGETMSLEEATLLAARFPERRPRPVAVDVEAEALEVAAETDALEESATARERRATSEAVAGVMREAMEELAAEDRAILRLHFAGGLSVAEIARSLGLVQRQLYRRIQRIYDALRKRLLARGVRAAEVTALLGRPDVDLEFGLREVEKKAAGTSTDVEGQATP